MTALTLLGAVFAIWLMLALHMLVAWRIEQRTGNSGWVDVAWTIAMGLTGIAAAAAWFAVDDIGSRQLLVVALVAIWALRLAGHISRRTTLVSDDPRYAKLREEWGDASPRNMFWLLQAQAALSVPMVLSIALAAWNPIALWTPMDALAIIVTAVGLAGSAVADWQLSRFKGTVTRPGQVCDVGLWSWSRHPNYFFEWLIWLGFALFAIDLSGSWSWGYLALAGPTCMYWLLRYVSGVPPLENHMLAKYGELYANYQRTTSTFFPIPPQLLKQ